MMSSDADNFYSRPPTSGPVILVGDNKEAEGDVNASFESLPGIVQEILKEKNWLSAAEALLDERLAGKRVHVYHSDGAENAVGKEPQRFDLPKDAESLATSLGWNFEPTRTSSDDVDVMTLPEFLARLENVRKSILNYDEDSVELLVIQWFYHSDVEYGCLGALEDSAWNRSKMDWALEWAKGLPRGESQAIQHEARRRVLVAFLNKACSFIFVEGDSSLQVDPNLPEDDLDEVMDPIFRMLKVCVPMHYALKQMGYEDSEESSQSDRYLELIEILDEYQLITFGMMMACDDERNKDPLVSLAEPHDTMSLDQVKEWQRRAERTDDPEDWIRVAYCVGSGVGRVPPNKMTRADILSRPKVGEWASRNIQQSRWAAYAMGIIHFYGLGEFKKDNVASMEAFQVGYRMKCPVCTTCLALGYWDGVGGKKDDGRAVALLQEAISYDSVWAKLILGNFYQEGRGVEQDSSKAFQLYSDVAEHFLVGVREKARCCERGIGVEKDLQKAMDLYQQASDAGYHKATYDLATLLEGGSLDDKKKAVAVLERGMQDGHADCTCYLGALYMEGEGFPKDESKAYSLFQQAANLGDAQAYLYMAECNDKGQGVPRDERRAIEFYEKAAALQSVKAMRVLGISYVQGLRGLAQDVSRGLDWLQRAAQKNDADAILLLGALYMDGAVVPKDESKGYLLLQEAASLGDAQAYFVMAECNDKGQGVPRDERRAVELYEKAAALQNANAMRVLGISYVQGLRGLAQDVSRGLDWLQRAAQKNDAEAILFLGALYMDGEVVPMDESKGYALFEKVAYLGHPRALYCLAVCSENGTGVPRDERRAIEFYEKAAALEDGESMTILGLSYLQGLRGLECDIPRGLEWLNRAARKNELEAIRSLAILYAGTQRGLAFLELGAELGDAYCARRHVPDGKKGDLCTRISVGLHPESFFDEEEQPKLRIQGLHEYQKSEGHEGFAAMKKISSGRTVNKKQPVQAEMEKHQSPLTKNNTTVQTEESTDNSGEKQSHEKRAWWRGLGFGAGGA